MFKSAAVAFLVVLAATPGVAQPLTKVLEAVQGTSLVDGSTVTEDISFVADRHDRMTVPVSVDGHGPFNFLVDTAADRTVVSTRLATRLNLAKGASATLHSATGSSKVWLANVSRLQITNGRVRSLSAPMLQASHMGADGILGMDSLRSERVIFDFTKNLISIAPSAVRPLFDGPGTIVVRGKLSRGHLILTNAKAQGIGVTAVVDTGSEVTIGNAALRRRLEAKRRLGQPRPLELMSVTGQLLLGDAYEIKELEIGGVTLKGLVVVFVEAHTFGKLGLKTKPAVLLGMNAMRAFDKVSVDFAAKKLRVLLPQEGSLRTVRVASR